VFALLVALTASGGVFAEDHGHGGGGFAGHAGPAHVEEHGHGGGFAGHAGPDHQHFDARFSHNHSYFDHGYAVHDAPRGGFAIDHEHDHYWYDHGNWYRRGDDLGWVVVGAPLGAFVSALPPYYSTVWFGGVPYYYANDTYYTWDDSNQEYEVVAPPDGSDSAGTAQASAGDTNFAYPMKGQSPDQQASDRYECHHSAVEKTGYDPTQPGGDVPPDAAPGKRDNYLRAEAACLYARGYSVQ
jgi:hypothetical protein